MLRRPTRLILMLTAALLAGALSAGSLAIASGDHQRSGHHHGWPDRQDPRPHPPGGPATCDPDGPPSPLDQAWLMRHLQTNLFEIAGGQAAQPKATVEAVRAFAAELVADHTAALDQATAVAEQVGVEPPTAPSPLQQWALRAVDTFTGPAFDRWFIELQIDGHTEAILETQFEIANGCNALVVQLAEAALPVLERHLAEAQAILATLEG